MLRRGLPQRFHAIPSATEFGAIQGVTGNAYESFSGRMIPPFLNVSISLRVPIAPEAVGSTQKGSGHPRSCAL